MLYNIKHIHLHCVFHGIRFKVNKDWVSGIDTLLFLYTFSSSFMVYFPHLYPQKNLPLACFSNTIIVFLQGYVDCSTC